MNHRFYKDAMNVRDSKNKTVPGLCLKAIEDLSALEKFLTDTLDNLDIEIDETELNNALWGSEVDVKARHHALKMNDVYSKRQLLTLPSENAPEDVKVFINNIRKQVDRERPGLLEAIETMQVEIQNAKSSLNKLYAHGKTGEFDFEEGHQLSASVDKICEHAKEAGVIPDTSMFRKCIRNIQVCFEELFAKLSEAISPRPR